MGFQLDEVSCLRELDHDLIDNSIRRRQEWREQAQQRWLMGRKNISTQIVRNRKEINNNTVEDLHSLTSVLLNSSAEFKLVVSVDQAYVYTNDVSLIDQIDCLQILRNKTYSRAKKTRPANTIQLKNPRHEFRSYFKVTKLSTSQKDYLMDFLHNQRTHIRTSPALQQWLDHPFNRTQDYFFVDYNSASWLSMLSLVSPGIVRKTMHIIAAK